eukprot:11778005-Prorocentrum_lima.AAC.1
MSELVEQRAIRWVGGQSWYIFHDIIPPPGSRCCVCLSNTEADPSSQPNGLDEYIPAPPPTTPH